MKALKLTAQPRAQKGSADMGRLRKEGVVPAVLYGEGKPAKTVQLKLHDFEQVLRGHTGEHMLMDLAIDGDRGYKVLLKEVQHHPVSGKIVHADFYEVSMTKKLRIGIPVKLVGEPVGVSQQGGVLEHVLREVEVECLPSDILEQFEVDVSALSIGQNMSVGDIKLDPAKYQILTERTLAIAAVAAPRVEEEPVAAEAAVEGAAAGEPEVIREKKDEEAGEGEAGEKAEGKKEGGKPEAGKKEAKPEAGKKEGKAKG